MRILIAIPASLFMGAAVAQSLNVTPPSAVVYGTASDPTLVYSGAVVWNDTSAAQDVWCTRVEVSVVPGSANAFAWMNSMPPGSATDPTPRPIVALGYSTDLQGVYFPNGTSGSSVIRYCFYTQPWMTDSVCTTVTYVTGAAGIQDEADVPGLLYYDATSGAIQAGWNVMGRVELEVMDAAGRMIMRATMTAGERFDVSGLPAGAYSVSIVGSAGARPLRFVVR